MGGVLICLSMLILVPLVAYFFTYKKNNLKNGKKINIMKEMISDEYLKNVSHYFDKDLYYSHYKKRYPIIPITYEQDFFHLDLSSYSNKELQAAYSLTMSFAKRTNNRETYCIALDYLNEIEYRKTL